jgi:hypothetical protein
VSEGEECGVGLDVHFGGSEEQEMEWVDEEEGVSEKMRIMQSKKKLFPSCRKFISPRLPTP